VGSQLRRVHFVQIGSRVQDQLSYTPIQELSNVDLVFRGARYFVYTSKLL